jgi:hypothetical protein
MTFGAKFQLISQARHVLKCVTYLKCTHNSLTVLPRGCKVRPPFWVHDDIGRLDDILPRYVENNGEIIPNSCVVVGYMAARYKSNKEKLLSLGFYIGFAVVLASS